MKPLIERITKSRAEFEVYVNKKDPAVPDAAIGVIGSWDVAYCAIKGQDEGESLANAELIAEAFNVAHETGKTPAELADERKEALDALRLVHAFIEDLRKSNPGYMRNLCLQDYGQMSAAFSAMYGTLARLTP